jgi:hypothetical protein
MEHLAKRAMAPMSHVSQADIMAAMEDALKMKRGTLGEKACAIEVDNWDSFGQLGIIVALDTLLNGEIANIAEMAEADSVPKVIETLRRHSLL